MNRLNTAAITLCLLGGLPIAAFAQTYANSSNIGPKLGERELSISGTGSSDQKFTSGGFGVSGDMGWYLRDDIVAGVRQSINYAKINWAGLEGNFWNGSTRGYVNYQFLTDNVRPFVGGSLGGIYGDEVQNSAFAGLETGLKYYVHPKTYFLTRVEYQFLFESTNEVTDAFKDNGAWAYTVGLGYNF